MPWEHCQTPAIADDQGCPTCGITKVEWTIKVATTRVFRLGAGKACKVELKDSGGAYAAGAAYRMELPDGTVAQGALNPAGYAKGTSKLPGDAVVSFPEHGAAVACVTPAARAGAGEGTFLCPVGGEKFVFVLQGKDWVEFTLEDRPGSPMAGVRYVMDLADGSVREGWTDAKGLVREERVPKGECRVRFPGPGVPLRRGRWLEVEVALPDGTLAPPGWRVQAKCEDGSTFVSTVRDRGLARFDRLPSGAACHVTLLDRPWRRESLRAARAGAVAT